MPHFHEPARVLVFRRTLLRPSASHEATVSTSSADSPCDIPVPIKCRAPSLPMMLMFSSADSPELISSPTRPAHQVLPTSTDHLNLFLPTLCVTSLSLAQVSIIALKCVRSHRGWRMWRVDALAGSTRVGAAAPLPQVVPRQSCGSSVGVTPRLEAGPQSLRYLRVRHQASALTLSRLFSCCFE